jgi:hypothetical protein
MAKLVQHLAFSLLPLLLLAFVGYGESAEVYEEIASGSCGADGCEDEEPLDQSAMLQLHHVEKSLLLDLSQTQDHASAEALQVMRDLACREWQEGRGNATMKAKFKKYCSEPASPDPLPCKKFETLCQQCKSDGEESCAACQYGCPLQENADPPNIPTWPGGCQEYCDLFMASCSAPNNPLGRYYKDTKECLDKCAGIPVTSFQVQQGNTMPCRAFHFSLSQSTTSQTAFHCNHVFYEDPMYICRNSKLKGFGNGEKDLREAVYLAQWVPSIYPCDGKTCHCDT